MQPLRIIYVDDEPCALENFNYITASCPILGQTVLFSVAEQALDYAKTHPLDFAFLDIDLPFTNGFALCEQLRNLQPQIKVAFITGNIHYMNPRNHPIQAPYLFKPYAKADLLAAIATYNK